MKPFYLGIDAGGTRCRARLCDADGRVLGNGTGGPANTHVGIDRLFAAISDATGQAIAEAGLDGAAVAAIRAGMGIAGITRAGMKPRIQALDWPFANVALTSDSVIANLGAHRGGDGAILILGTGSVAMIRRGEDMYSIGGYGFPISDEGSGAALGLSAIRHALRALDGRTRPTPLSQAVTQQFGNAIPNVIAWMDDATPGDYAQLAPMVFDFAENGDEIALSIIRDAAQHVERFIETIVAEGAIRCALMGGVAQRIKPWLRARVVDRLVEPMGDAVDGAIIFAGGPVALHA
ncbi:MULTISPECIES: BadF/BadG/BcrA/BcrD ATPase family protein [unclassified Sphingomonas]|uniref:BadF/BadG/BcrA/BcrD ATPase family protein n=1 Tax=unclassified Sphingomonas TaxID=196159 RepID=UPI0008335E8E|nr:MULTISPECIES: BadF/BadG/BcrA/BcrD ATPase family protein [unclassified Sphingomonas]